MFNKREREKRRGDEKEQTFFREEYILEFEISVDEGVRTIALQERERKKERKKECGGKERKENL